MPSKTKYTNRQNKTRRHNNKTRKSRQTPSNCKLAKLMRGGGVFGGNGDEKDADKKDDKPDDKPDDTSDDKKETETTKPTHTPLTPESKPVDTNTETTTPPPVENIPPPQVDTQQTEGIKLSTTVTIHHFGATDTNLKTIIQETTYGELLNDKTNDKVMIVKGDSFDNAVVEFPSAEDIIKVGDPSVDLYTYRYKDAETEKNNLEKIPITKTDDTSVTIDTNVLGNNILYTNYYIDKQGILRKYDNIDKIIHKVLIVDVPKDESKEPLVDNTDIAKEATETLNRLETLLQKIKEMLPSYMEVTLDGKNYIISKDNPYIVVDIPPALKDEN